MFKKLSAQIWAVVGVAVFIAVLTAAQYLLDTTQFAFMLLRYIAVGVSAVLGVVMIVDGALGKSRPTGEHLPEKTWRAANVVLGAVLLVICAASVVIGVVLK